MSARLAIRVCFFTLELPCILTPSSVEDPGVRRHALCFLPLPGRREYVITVQHLYRRGCWKIRVRPRASFSIGGVFCSPFVNATQRHIQSKTHLGFVIFEFSCFSIRLGNIITGHGSIENIRDFKWNIVRTWKGRRDSRKQIDFSLHLDFFW